MFAAHDAQLTEERYNLLNAWLAVLPGNSAYNLRRLWLLEHQLRRSVLSFHARHRARSQNAHLGAEYLAVLETNRRHAVLLQPPLRGHRPHARAGGDRQRQEFPPELPAHPPAEVRARSPSSSILGGSYESLTRLFGGAYAAGRASQSDRSRSIRSACRPRRRTSTSCFPSCKVLIESSGYQADRRGRARSLRADREPLRGRAGPAAALDACQHR